MDKVKWKQNKLGMSHAVARLVLGWGLGLLYAFRTMMLMIERQMEVMKNRLNGECLPQDLNKLIFMRDL